jgi:hypothetical protein
MTDMLKVKDHENLRRDSFNNAVINIDKQEYVASIKRRQRSERVEYLEQKVSDLQNDIQDIKQMLQQLVSK